MYLSHLRKTEIWNFSSVLRILWNEFRNYLILLFLPEVLQFSSRNTFIFLPGILSFLPGIAEPDLKLSVVKGPPA